MAASTRSFCPVPSTLSTLSPSWFETIIDAVEMTVSIPRQASCSERGFLRSPAMSSTPMRARFATLSGFAVERTKARTGLSATRSWRQISPPKPTGPVAPTTRYMINSSANPHEAAGGLRRRAQCEIHFQVEQPDRIAGRHPGAVSGCAASSASAALPGLPLLRLHGYLHAFENHRILKRHEVIEGSLVKRVFAEESEYPPRTDLLTARERDVLSRQIACLGDCGADLVDELAFRLYRYPWRDEEITDGAHWVTKFTVDTHLLGRPLAQKDSCVGDHVRVVDELGDLLDQSFLDIDSKAGRQIEVRDGHVNLLQC